MILTILAAVFVFGLLVLVHEFGHFITAKLTGMRVDEFAIGFGPQIFKTRLLSAASMILPEWIQATILQATEVFAKSLFFQEWL